MSWFTRNDSSVEKKLKADDAPKPVRTEGLWQKCDGCRGIIWKKDLEGNHNVCPSCGAHFRIDAVTRLRLLFDNGDYEEIDSQLRSTDPLEFVDSKPYRERLKSTREATKLNDALVSARGVLSGRRVYICAMEPRFIGGSMGSVMGEKI